MYPSSELKVEVPCYSEMFVYIYKFIRRYNPEDHYGHIHRCENRKKILIISSLVNK